MVVHVVSLDFLFGQIWGHWAAFFSFVHFVERNRSH